MNEANQGAFLRSDTGDLASRSKKKWIVTALSVATLLLLAVYELLFGRLFSVSPVLLDSPGKSTTITWCTITGNQNYLSCGI